MNRHAPRAQTPDRPESQGQADDSQSGRNEKAGREPPLPTPARVNGDRRPGLSAPKRKACCLAACAKTWTPRGCAAIRRCRVSASCVGATLINDHRKCVPVATQSFKHFEAAHSRPSPNRDSSQDANARASKPAQLSQKPKRITRFLIIDDEIISFLV